LVVLGQVQVVKLVLSIEALALSDKPLLRMGFGCLMGPEVLIALIL